MITGTVRYEHWELRVDGVDLRVATACRDGDRTPLVFLHGFGSTKEDYLDAARQPALARHALLAYDAPGCGQSTCADLSRVSIPFQVQTARAVLARAGIDRFHLVGHSMGGLTGLLLAHTEPDRPLSFIDIEGNLAPEDCFLSRQILDHAAGGGDFLDELAERARQSGESSSALFAASVRHKVRAGAVRAIFTSMVELSDHRDLISMFLALPCPRTFVYGAENSTLSYLPKLRANGVQTAEIPRSGHWPMYANPTAMWNDITALVSRTEGG
jgi:pimeloyl-ACP methyl ester carboxylesterase